MAGLITLSTMSHNLTFIAGRIIEDRERDEVENSIHVHVQFVLVMMASVLST